MARYGTFNYGEELYGGDGGSYIPPIEYLEGRVPWIFQSIESDDSYEFAINPVDASIPSIQKTITSQSTASGVPVYFQGKNVVPTMSFSGTILTEIHYMAMKLWSSVDKQISVTDDLGSKYWVYIKSFAPTRNYVPEFPWRHDFTVEAVVLDWA